MPDQPLNLALDRLGRSLGSVAGRIDKLEQQVKQLTTRQSPAGFPEGYVPVAGSNGRLTSYASTFNFSATGAGAFTALELGAAATGNRYAYIDFHGDDTYTDYGLRIIRGNAGANANTQIIQRGTGAIQIVMNEAGLFSVYGTSASETLRVNGASQVVIAPALSGSSGSIASNDALHIKTSHGWNGLHIFQDRNSSAQDGHGFFFVAEPGVTFNSATLSYNWMTSGASQARANTSQGASYIRLYQSAIDFDMVDSAGVDRHTHTFTAGGTVFTHQDAGTTNRQYLSLGHNSTGTAGASFGSGIQFNAQSTTTVDRPVGTIDARWTVATDASRRSEMIFIVYDATTFRLALQLGTSGAAAAIGFLGTAPQVQQTGGALSAAATYGANEQTMLNRAFGALRTFGLLS